MSPQHPAINEAQRAILRHHTNESTQFALDTTKRRLFSPLIDSVRSLSGRQAVDGTNLETPLLSLLTSLVQLLDVDSDSTRTLLKNINRAFTDAGDAPLNLLRPRRDRELEAF